MTEQAFIQAILTEADDHVHRLVFADWLLDVDPAREPLVRRQGLLGPSLQAPGGLKLVPIPAGAFLMGSPAREAHRDPDEQQHPVTLTHSFYLGATPVTVGQYRQFVRTTGYRRPNDGAVGWDAVLAGWVLLQEYSWRNPGWKQRDDEPVVCLDHYDALAFCRWLTICDGRPYRLPTEAEWEYACRAGSATTFACGDQLRPEQANFDTMHPYRGTRKQKGIGRTTHVGKYPANAFGLYDMHGNVWEWCHDWYGFDYFRRSAKRNPQGPRSGYGRVLRGGSWFNAARDCRSALRRCGHPFFSRYRDGNTGFRVALTMSEEPGRRGRVPKKG